MSVYSSALGAFALLEEDSTKAYERIRKALSMASPQEGADFGVLHLMLAEVLERRGDKQGAAAIREIGEWYLPENSTEGNFIYDRRFWNKLNE